MKSAILVLALSLAAFGSAGPALADDAPPAKPAAPEVAVPPIHDPDAVKFMATLEKEITKQTDEEALVSIKQLVIWWKDPAVKAETKAPMPGLVAWYAKRESLAVALAAVDGLAEIGKGEGSKNLLALLELRLMRDDARDARTEALFGALKKVADPDEAVVKALLNLFHYKDDVIVAMAADAVGGYVSAPVELRKTLFEEVLRAFEGVASESRRPTNKAAFNRWSIVGGPVLSTIAALSHRSFEDLATARQWFNDHGKDVDAWK